MKVDFKLHKQINPVQEQGVKVRYGTTKRVGYKIRWFAILFIVLSPVATITYKFMYPYVVNQAPAILSFTPIAMVAPEAGLISIHLKSVGDDIKKGDALYKVRDTALNAEIAFLEAEVEKFNSDISQSKTLQLYRDKVSFSEKNLTEMEVVYDRYLHFSKLGQVSAIDLAAIINLYNNAKSQLSSAQVELLEQQTNYSLAGQYASSLRSVEKALAIKQAQKNQLTVYSPYDATIIESSVISRQSVSKGESIMMISKAQAKPEVVAYLDAKHILSTEGSPRKSQIT